MKRLIMTVFILLMFCGNANAVDLWFDVDTALSEVPVNIYPLIDDTDFKTIEEAVAYNAAGMDLNWNFVTTAGVQTQTNVTPTTAGDYDWVHAGNGMYVIEIPASGGVSINNDTEGFGWFSGVATGVLPWRGPVCGFRKASMNNVEIDNGTLQDNLEDTYDGTGFGFTGCTMPTTTTVTNEVTADCTKISGDATAADNAELAFDGTGYGFTACIMPTTTSVTNGVTVTTNNDKAGYTLSSSGVDAVWDEVITGHATADSFGKVFGDEIDGLRAYGDSNWSTATGFSTHSAADVADAVWDELRADHVVDGTFGGDALDDDIWTSTIASYIDVAISSRAPANEYDAQMGYIPSDLGDVPTASELNAAHGAGSWSTATGFSTHSAADVADAVWDELRADHVVDGTFGGDALDDDIWTSTIASYIDAAISSRAPANEYDAQMGYIPSDLGDVPTASELNAAHGAGSWSTATGFSTHSAADVWLSSTRTLTALDEDDTTIDLDSTMLNIAFEGSYTWQDYLRLTAAMVLGESSGSGYFRYWKALSDDSVTRVTTTMDANGYRTNQVYDPDS